jgi:GT2 family glycosyltransferase
VTEPDPQVVVVAYHEPEALDRCLAALEGQLAVTVVDNSSSAEVRAVAERHAASYLDSGTNVGFAAGVNSALATLGPDAGDVLLLNPDATIGPLELAKLAAFMHAPENERVAAVSPRLLDGAGHEQRVAWPYPTPLRMCLEAVGLGRVPYRGAFLIGAVLLLRGEALRAVGRLDERFFLYAEETDWQRRALDAGWRSAICPDVTARHAGAGSSSDPRRREALFHAAQETYIRKWFGRGGWSVYRAAACAGAGARALLLTRERRAEAARRMRLYLLGPRRCAAVGAE